MWQENFSGCPLHCYPSPGSCKVRRKSQSRLTRRVIFRIHLLIENIVTEGIPFCFSIKIIGINSTLTDTHTCPNTQITCWCTCIPRPQLLELSTFKRLQWCHFSSDKLLVISLYHDTNVILTRTETGVILKEITLVFKQLERVYYLALTYSNLRQINIFSY